MQSIADNRNATFPIQRYKKVLLAHDGSEMSDRAARPAAGDEQPDLPEPAPAPAVEQEEAPAPNEPELAAAAMAERRDSGPPRRGWWSRFVRKDE